jgi:hypothetical protein
MSGYLDTLRTGIRQNMDSVDNGCGEYHCDRYGFAIYRALLGVTLRPAITLQSFAILGNLAHTSESG